jgi:hypothetical protein
MITIPQLTAQALGAFLAQETKGRFVASQSGLTELLPFAASLTMECIGNSDALSRARTPLSLRLETINLRFVPAVIASPQA